VKLSRLWRSLFSAFDDIFTLRNTLVALLPFLVPRDRDLERELSEIAQRSVVPAEPVTFTLSDDDVTLLLGLRLLRLPSLLTLPSLLFPSLLFPSLLTLPSLLFPSLPLTALVRLCLQRRRRTGSLRAVRRCRSRTRCSTSSSPTPPSRSA
jgi:hypothetical protein